MTLLEKITRELPNARVEPAELNGRPAWKITLARADSSDGGTFEALVYQEAARVQIRHLDAFRAAKVAVETLRGRPILPRSRPTSAQRECLKEIAHFKALSGFQMEVTPMEVHPMARIAPNEGTCSICDPGVGKCFRHGKDRAPPAPLAP
jgi:hypothetical protein